MKKHAKKIIPIFLLISTISQIYGGDITDLVFESMKEGVIAAFGDLNSDELTDVFIIRSEFSTLEILYGAEKEPLLRTGPYCFYKDAEIVSVIPGDFDGDALMDVFVAVRPKGSKDDIYDVHINWGTGDVVECSKSPMFKIRGDPLALDFNRDMIIDLYGLTETGERAFWVFSDNRKFPKRIDQVPPDVPGTPAAEMSLPNANAYLDLNNDFIAGLFVQTKKYFEIWDGGVVDGFVFNHTINYDTIGIKADDVIGQAAFMDFQLKGRQNIVLPICVHKDCSNSTILVHDGKNFYDINVEFKDGQGVTWGFVPPIADDLYLKTITARSGDFNMDGYPDILLTLQPINRPKQTRVFYLKNVPCRKCNSPIKRTLEVQWNALYPMGNQTVAGAFYDFYQDGILDVILIEKNDKGAYRPFAFRNTLDYDANFVKVIVLTGLVNPKNPTERTRLGRKKRTYGTNLPGPRITYSTTTQENDKQFGSSVQLPQSSYFALQLPYTIFGLGRTPNFVDLLTVGLGGNSRQWTQIIPNSQINVVPKPLEDPKRWKAQLFVTPSKLIIMSVIALGATCLIIVLIILVLYIKEKREDKLQKLQEVHRFHYDAM